MDLLSDQIQNMSICEECYTAKDLSNENEFLKNSEKKTKKLFSNVICRGFFVVKVSWCYLWSLNLGWQVTKQERYLKSLKKILQN